MAGLEGITGAAGNILDKILRWPDSFEHPAARKAARIAYCVLMIMLAGGLFLAMNGVMQGGNMAALADPSLTTLMSVPMVLGVMGVGIAWLLQDSTKKEHHRAMAKVAAIALPLLIFAGMSCFIAAGVQHGIQPISANFWTMIGVMALPLGFYATAYAIQALGSKEEPYVVSGSAPQTFAGSGPNQNKAVKMQRRQLGSTDEYLEMKREAARIQEERTDSFDEFSTDTEIGS